MTRSAPRAVLLLALTSLIAALALPLLWWLSRPVEPGPFYARQGTDLPAKARPGHLIRHATFDTAVPAGAQARRILYATTDVNGAPALASAVVLHGDGPTGQANSARPVILWTHGTTGVQPGCAPSLLPEPFANVPALQQALAQGWVIVAPDYMGLGTTGPHPYLIGPGQAHSALDAVRAVRQLPGPRTSDQTVVWGHSQGGHAALWTGIVAPGYAPDVPLSGVAAAAPATDLPALIERIQHTPVGRIMTSYVLQAYSATYPDVGFDAYVRGPVARVLARDMASRCLSGGQALFSVAEALALGGSIFAAAPTQGQLGQRLSDNTPDRALTSPVLIAQGEDDDLVLPDVQASWVQRRCRDGQAIEFVRYPRHDHLSLVTEGSPFSKDLIAWTQARLQGQPTPASCQTSVWTQSTASPAHAGSSL